MSSLIDNIKMVYIQPELDMSIRPEKPTDWELYLEKRFEDLDKCVDDYHSYYLILQRIVNIVLSGKGITDNKVKYLIKDRFLI